MADLSGDMTMQLRKLAVQLVRDRRTSDAAAVLAGVGALELMYELAGDQSGQHRRAEDRPADQQPAPQNEEHRQGENLDQPSYQQFG